MASMLQVDIDKTRAQSDHLQSMIGHVDVDRDASSDSVPTEPRVHDDFANVSRTRRLRADLKEMGLDRPEQKASALMLPKPAQPIMGHRGPEYPGPKKPLTMQIDSPGTMRTAGKSSDPPGRSRAASVPPDWSYAPLPDFDAGTSLAHLDLLETDVSKISSVPKNELPNPQRAVDCASFAVGP